MTAPICFAEDRYASGQPTPEHLAELARKGVRTVINLRTPGELTDYHEPAAVDRLGMEYVALPIAGAVDLDYEHVRQFGLMLDEARRRGGVLIHCASSNRAGAMVALDAALNRGESLQVALAQGRAAGLSTLEPAVIALAEREQGQP